MIKKLPKTALIFLIATPLLFIIRCLQYSAVIRPEDGFFIYKGGFLSDAYYVFFVIAVALLAVFYFFDKKNKTGISKRRVTRLSPVSATVGGVVFALTGLLLAYEAIKSASNGGLVTALMFFLATVGYIGIGYVIFTSRRLLPLCGLALLVLAVFYVFGAGTEFMTRIYIANLSSRLIILLADLLLALFCLSCGKAFIRAEARLTPMFTGVFGYSAALLIFSDGLARLVYAITLDSPTRSVVLNESTENGFNLPEVYFFVQGLAVLWIVFTLSSKKKYTLDRLIKPKSSKEGLNPPAE